MKIEIVELDKIHPDPANVRVHPKKNLDAIKDSLHRFGQQKPIVVNEQDCILAGNGTYMAAKEMGWPSIAIVRTTLDGIDATAYAIADNRTGELAAWDEPALAKIMRDLQREDKLHGIGFETDDLNKILKSINNEGPDCRATEPAGVGELDPKWEVVVECVGEQEQQEVFEKLTEEGHKCRVLTF